MEVLLPDMTKAKNNRPGITTPAIQQISVINTENKAVRHDLIQTIVVNLIFLGLLIGLYFWNVKSNGGLNQWIDKIVNL